MAYFEELPVGKLLVTGGGLAGGVYSFNPGVTATHKQVGHQNQSVFTFNNAALTIPTATKYAGLLLFTMPKGLISFQGSVVTLTETTISAIASTLTSSAGVFSVGSAAASSTTLSSTMANFLGSTAITPSATINVAGTTASAGLGTPASVDGTSTAIPIYLNMAFASMSTADASILLNGKVTVTWNWLGAY